MLKEGEPTEEPEPVRLKIDPGSQTTGLVVVNDATGGAGIHVRYCQPLQRGDGYRYTKGAALPPQA
jgi:hypothetical protein